MNWLDLASSLKSGKTVQCRPRGNSMQPLIESGQLITIAPATEYAKGDIAFCKVNGSFYVHLVTAVGADGRVQISNNRGHVNGWTRTVFGKVIRVEN